MKEITIEEKGCAKVNLALHVTGVKEDGYHILDSIVIFTDIFDKTEISCSADCPPHMTITC